MKQFHQTTREDNRALMRPSFIPQGLRDKLRLRLTAQKINDAGFSLMELVVTVLILGVIIAIAVLYFGGAQDSARQAAVESAARNA